MTEQQELEEFDMLGYNTYVCGLCGEVYSDCKEHGCFKVMTAIEGDE